MTHPVSESQIAVCALLSLPDPADLKRGHVLRFAGTPERHRINRYLEQPMRWTVGRLVERENERTA